MTFEQEYSGLDRALHRMAFSSPVVQLSAADVEGLLYGKRFREFDVRRPVFITSLPRAGTTLLLEILAGVPGFASHNYRDMPFVMAPVLWNSISRSFRKAATLRERAHGDGMQVGYDSPEAFEEVLWRAHWPGKYHVGSIDLWAVDEDAEEFREFFTEHMQKILFLRSDDGTPGMRYVSKNNANIARIELLRRLFPDGQIIVPFRSPIQQAASLLRQHIRFLESHHVEPFTRRYMGDIGHLEFGELHRPIIFDSADEWRSTYDSGGLDYWVVYWMTACRHLLKLEEHVTFISYERLCSAGADGIRKLLRTVEGDDVGGHPDLRAPRPYPENDLRLSDPQIGVQALGLHEELLSISLL